MVEETKKPAEKTEEQLSEERAKRYIQDPKSFVELSELACAAILDERSSMGVGVMVGNMSRATMNNAQTELNHAINKLRLTLDMDAAVKSKSGIFKPGPGSMHRFARGKK